MRYRYNVCQTTEEVVSAVVNSRYKHLKDPIAEPVQKAAVWFVTRTIPAFLRTEENVWKEKENFRRIVHHTKRFCDLYDRGKIGIFYSKHKNGFEILRCRFGQT